MAKSVKKQIDGLRVSTVLLVAGAVVLFVFSSVMWRRFIAFSDTRVVWGAIENALSTKGVTIVTDDSDGSTIRKTTLIYNLDDNLSTEARTEFKDDTIDSIIKTVSTRDKDFLFYEKNNNANNSRSREFEGLWADISVSGQTESKTLSDNLTNGSLFFIGNIPTTDRQELVQEMRDQKLYTIDKLIRIEQIDGRQVRVYEIRINADAYNRLLVSYLEAIGLTQAASQVSANSSSGLMPVAEIAIDALSREIVATGYPTIGSEGDRTYSDWDTRSDIEVPESYITTEELQKKIDSIYTPTEKL